MYALDFVSAAYEGGFGQEIDYLAPGFMAQVEAQSTPSRPWYETALNTLSTVVMTDYQRRLLNIQLDRARQGLPPLSSADYGVGVQVGMDPATRQLLVLGGVALLVALLMMRKR